MDPGTELSKPPPSPTSPSSSPSSAGPAQPARATAIISIANAARKEIRFAPWKKEYLFLFILVLPPTGIYPDFFKVYHEIMEIAIRKNRRGGFFGFSINHFSIHAHLPYF
jgi:hypothetical protein